MAGDEPEESAGSHGGWDQVAETAQIFEAELIARRVLDHPEPRPEDGESE